MQVVLILNDLFKKLYSDSVGSCGWVLILCFNDSCHGACLAVIVKLILSGLVVSLCFYIPSHHDRVHPKKTFVGWSLSNQERAPASWPVHPFFLGDSWCHSRDFLWFSTQTKEKVFICVYYVSPYASYQPPVFSSQTIRFSSSADWAVQRSAPSAKLRQPKTWAQELPHRTPACRRVSPPAPSKHSSASGVCVGVCTKAARSKCTRSA